MEITLYIIGFLMVVMTAVPLFKHEAWWIRVFDFPRLQIVFIALAVLVLYIALVGVGGWLGIAFIILLAASLVYQAYMMFPYTRLARKQVQDATDVNSPKISILFANVLMTNRKADRVKTLIQQWDPDILLLVETDEWWLEQMTELECRYPYTVLHPLDNTYGMLLFSRLELANPEVKFLIQDDIPSIHSGVMLENGSRVEIRCLHPRPPVPNEESDSLPRDAEILIVGKENREDPRPFIVFGDLNDVAWSRTNYLFQDISGLLDPRVGRGFYHTFHADIPLLRFPLDHFFHSKHFRVADFRRLPNIGSDHFPVYIKLSLEWDAPIVQEELAAEPEERIEAERTIETALAREG
ncbi:MAG TPA: endonuclease/exonuclease/phosphatase family protein [Pyrinomonadaceae bacterium]|nr:endonuclease/exonuclease/phosphatase family protein [Pyrinomonadaceae bacterium]